MTETNDAADRHNSKMTRRNEADDADAQNTNENAAADLNAVVEELREGTEIRWNGRRERATVLSVVDVDVLDTRSVLVKTVRGAHYRLQVAEPDADDDDTVARRTAHRVTERDEYGRRDALDAIEVVADGADVEPPVEVGDGWVSDSVLDDVEPEAHEVVAVDRDDMTVTIALSGEHTADTIDLSYPDVADRVERHGLAEVDVDVDDSSDDDEPATDGGEAKLLADGRGRLDGVDERADVVDDPVDRSGDVCHISAIREGDVVEVERARDVLPIRITADHIHGNFAEGVVDETTDFAGHMLVEGEAVEIHGLDERSRWSVSAAPVDRLTIDDTPTIVATGVHEPDVEADDSDDDPDAGAADSGHASAVAAQLRQADDDLLAEIREQRDEQDADDVDDDEPDVEPDVEQPDTGDALGDFDLDEHDQQFGEVDDVDPDSVTRWQAGGVAVDRGDGPVTDGGIVVADDGAEIIDDDDVDGADDADDRLLADGRGDVIVAGDGAEIMGDGSGSDRQPNGAAGSIAGMADTSDAWRDDVSARLGTFVDELSDAGLLTELQALAWVLRDVEGEPRAAAADVMGCSKSTLDKHLSVARDKMGQTALTVLTLENHGIDVSDVDPSTGKPYPSTDLASDDVGAQEGDQ